MPARVLLLVLTVFWVTMNVLLWRAEYGSRPGIGSSVPTRVVWDKILTAPDSSSLTVFRKGKKIGFCHWITSVGEDLSRMSSIDAPPEGMVRKIVNYRLELDGNVMLSDAADRLRFDSHLSLDSDKQWQDFDLRLNLRPTSCEIKTRASNGILHILWQDDTGKTDRVLKLSDLQNPALLLQELAGPVGVSLLSGMGFPSNPSSVTNQTAGLTWEARHESIRLGHSSVRAYRLQAKLLDRFYAVIFVSRAGEILRAELPDGITLANDQLGGN